MSHIIARSVALGMFAVGAFLGATAVASATPPPGDEEYYPSPIGEAEDQKPNPFVMQAPSALPKTTYYEVTRPFFDWD